MKICSFYGVRKFLLCLGYRGDAITEYFENYHARINDFTMVIKDKVKFFHDGNGRAMADSDVDDWEITFAITGIDTMTGGRIKPIQKYINEDLFFCTYGDGVSDVNIRELFAFHKDKGSRLERGIRNPAM